MSRRIYATVGLALLLVASGCGKRVGMLMGEVSYLGKPVVSGTVTVVDADGYPHSGSIQFDGRYTINNIPAGPIRIAVESPDPRGDGETPPAQSDDPTPPKKISGWRPIPAKYADVATSDLTFQLKPGPNSFNFELTGAAP